MAIVKVSYFVLQTLSFCRGYSPYCVSFLHNLLRRKGLFGCRASDRGTIGGSDTERADAGARAQEKRIGGSLVLGYLLYTNLTYF